MVPAYGFDARDPAVVRASDVKEHPLAAFDLLGGCHSQAIAGNAERGEELDGDVALGGVPEEGDDPGHGLGVSDEAGPDLGILHGGDLNNIGASGTVLPNCGQRASYAVSLTEEGAIGKLVVDTFVE